MPAQVVSIPIDRVEPHPKLMLRFTYDVASLADLIKSAADENAPNGQLEPGRVVPKGDGKSYLVYIGVRRYLALRKLFERTHDSRFFTYSAYVDSGLSELQMFVRAKMENEEEKGERQGLSVLEEVFGLSKIRDSVSKEKKLDSDLKREFDVAVRLGEEKVRKLFQVESATHFRFRLGHLEGLGAIEDEKEFYLSAACIAGFDLGVDRIDEGIQGKDAAYTLDWFKRLFPGLKEPEKGSSAAQSQSITSSAEDKKKEDGAQADEDQPLEVHEKEVLVVTCPGCQNENMLVLRINAEVTKLPSNPIGARATSTPDIVLRCECGCSSCSEHFYVFIEPTGGRGYATETSLSPKFREPKTTIQAIDLRVDNEENVWQKIEGEQVPETVGTPPRREAGT